MRASRRAFARSLAPWPGDGVQQRGTATGIHPDGRWQTLTDVRAGMGARSSDRMPTKLVRTSTVNL